MSANAEGPREGLAGLALAEFVEAMGRKVPTPGGGAAAAVTAAIGESAVKSVSLHRRRYSRCRMPTMFSSVL